MSNGYDPLDIQDSRGAKADPNLTRQIKALPFTILDKRIQTFSDELLYDQYNSLATAYSPDRYRCSASMWLDDAQNKRRLKLVTGTSGLCSLSIYSKREFDMESYDMPEHSGVYQVYYEDLQSMARKEQQRYNILWFSSVI